MSRQAVKDTFALFQDRQAAEGIRWDLETSNRFRRLLGSGYIQESLRSLWQSCSADQRIAVGHLIDVAENWRTYLRQTPGPDPAVNAAFLDVAGSLLDYLEGRRELPPCSLPRVENGRLVWEREKEEAHAVDVPGPCGGPEEQILREQTGIPKA